MRFIDQEQLKPRIAHLLPALEQATAEVLAAPDPVKRKEIIKKNQAAWTALREEMMHISHGKCWYTESSNPGTDDDIDHFRPKLRLTGVGHPGYYWLAFDWTNYRLSCHRANRLRRASHTGPTGGKGSSFPIVDESKRAFSEDDNWRLERPLFLDPCDPQDPPMLTFWPNGESALAPDYAGDPMALKRWKVSRLGLHIDWPDFVDRRLQLYNRISRLIERGVREEPVPNGQNSDAFRDVLRDLCALMKPEADFSAAARAYVEGFGHVWWVSRIVLRVC